MADNRATLINPKTGERRAVVMGSAGEKQSFAEGFQLETQSPSVPEATYKSTTSTPSRTTTALSGQSQANLYSKGYVPEVNIYKGAYGEQEMRGATTGTDDAIGAVSAAMANIKKDQGLVQEQIDTKGLKTPEYQYYTDYTSEIEKTRESAQDLLAARKASIEADFAIRQEEQEISNRAQVGLASLGLAAMGAYGRSGSAYSYMKQVQVQNEREINKLLVQKQQTLIAAEEAFLNNDFQLLGKLIDENTRVTDQYNNIQSQMLEDSIKTAQEIDRQAEFGWKTEDRAMEKISTLAASDLNYEDLSEDAILDLETKAGLPKGTFQSIWNLQKEVAEIQVETDKYNKVYDTLSKIPKGQVVEIGGQLYTGMKDTDFTLVTDGDKQKLLKQKEDGTFEVIDLGLKGKGLAGNYSPATLNQIGNTISSAFADGDIGGECGEFMHQFVSDWPGGLNTVEEKQAQADDSIGINAGQSYPQIGDIVIQSAIGTKYEKNGHVSIINYIDTERGIMYLTESNKVGFHVVSNNRQLNVSDASVLGFYRGTIRNEFTEEMGEKSQEKTDKELEKQEKDFDSYVGKRMEQLITKKVKFEVAHDLVYTKFKDLLDAQADELGYEDGRILLDEILEKNRFVK